MCCFEALVWIVLQTKEIPHKHACMFNGYMAIISCSKLIPKHFSEKKSPLLALQVNMYIIGKVRYCLIVVQRISLIFLWCMHVINNNHISMWKMSIKCCSYSLKTRLLTISAMSLQPVKTYKKSIFHNAEIEWSTLYKINLLMRMGSKIVLC